MATKPKGKAPSKVELDVHLGEAGLPVGKLVYVNAGPREFSQFAYTESWLRSADYFDISADLDRTLGHQVRKPASKDESCFFLALADTEPDTWGRRVIARAHARERKTNPALSALTELDYLLGVDDYSRIGALRLFRGTSHQRTTDASRRSTPPLLDLGKLYKASRAVELSKESQEDLRYLQGKATSLGGMRPKCTVLEEDGWLALGKFPSVNDERSVTRGEVLALRLASLAGIEVASSRIAMIDDVPVAVIRRFDRTKDNGRIPYMSGTAMLQARKGDERAYTEVVDVMRTKSLDFVADARQLWRRLVFNHLITNVDDHLHNIGFLYVHDNKWRLSPAFDLNPFPGKERESKTWLSEDTGPVTSIAQLLGQAPRFELNEEQARHVLREVVRAVEQWRVLAISDDVGLLSHELDDFEPAFEHEDLAQAHALSAS
jgi:serine/threonine-protein kinase HipA